ncbi:MAG: translation elongation factor Ts [Elainellaceae cyanobacterium]
MAEISAKLVKELREKTGAPMMDCKKALSETDGNMEKASDWLRQKGISSAEKKAGKVAAEGLVGSYIHTGGRVGVLVEVNCQTDFVARNEVFQELVKNIAMQIAACPNVEYVSTEDIPPSVAEKEKEIEMGRDDLSKKPVDIREKIVKGRIDKRLKELALLDQPYIRDQSITVDELVKRTSGEIGEKVAVRRFARFVLGEGIEKEESDFAAEVAAQTGQKEASKPAAEKTAAEEVSPVKPTVDRPADGTEADSQASEKGEKTAKAEKAEKTIKAEKTTKKATKKSGKK